MKCRGTILSGVMVLSGGLFTLAVAKENPYQSIIDRNAFGLKPPPPPPTNVVEATPPMTVKLTGLISLGGDPKAFFELTEAGPGKLPKRPPGMSRGEELDGVKVLDIDVDRGEVKIRNGTAEKTLNFEQDGVKSSTAGAPAVPRTAGVPPMTSPGIRPAITTPGVGVPALANPAGANRAVTVTGGSGTPVPGGVTVTGGAGSGLVAGISTPTAALTSIPTRTMRVTPSPEGQVGVVPGGGSASATQPQMSYEQSVLSVAVATELTRGLVERGEHPPFPPTELTPDPPKLPGAIAMPQIATNFAPIPPTITVPRRLR